jgi:asparagine synthase (glutamine-hydrolysing)
MCGFVAVCGENAGEPGLIEAGVGTLRHRGPDGTGVWRSPDNRVALGHVRLAIIDLSDSAAQPMISRDGKAAIAFNGEIYNFRELAPAVREPLRTQSDTEVLLELLRQEGAAALQRLRGMFAFAYWDGEELLLARDRVGIKPLFYAETPSGIAAASEPGALLAMGAAEPTPDPRAIDDFLSFLYVPPPRTGILGIRQLPPAHLLRWRPGKPLRVERYWRLPSRSAVKPTANEVREIIADAVGSHLVSDTPVGVFLSGGLDSSSIVALAAPLYSGRLRTFNVIFGAEGSDLDERRYARQVAERYGTEHTEIPVEANVTEILPQMVALFGQPFGNPTSVLTFALSREARRYVKVALAGDGGDEALGGYPRYGGILVSSLYRSSPRALQRLTRMLVELFAPSTLDRSLVGRRLNRFVKSLANTDEEMYFRWLSYLDTPGKELLFKDRRAYLGADYSSQEHEFFFSVREQHSGVKMRDAAALIDLETFLPNNVLAYGDRMSMAHGLEVRVPFCDHVLLEKLAALPALTKMPAGTQKGLLRYALRKDLPLSVLLHRKQGFNPPIGQWLKRDLAPLLDDYLGPDGLTRRGIFDPRLLADLRKSFEAGASDSAHTLWSLSVLEAWMRWLD